MSFILSSLIALKHCLTILLFCEEIKMVFQEPYNSRPHSLFHYPYAFLYLTAPHDAVHLKLMSIISRNW